METTSSFGSIGLCSDGQIFNHSELKENLEDITEPLIEGGRNVNYMDFLPRDDFFALKPWIMKPVSSRALSRNDRICNYRISRGRYNKLDKARGTECQNGDLKPNTSFFYLDLNPDTL